MQEAYFDCISIDNVELDSAWYYSAYSGCQNKATKGPSSLMCAKFDNTNFAGVEGVNSNLTTSYLIFLEFDFCFICKGRSKIFVYDNNDQVVFVLLCDAGSGLIEKNAAELVDNYLEVTSHQLRTISHAIRTHFIPL